MRILMMLLLSSQGSAAESSNEARNNSNFNSSIRLARDALIEMVQFVWNGMDAILLSTPSDTTLTMIAIYNEWLESLCIKIPLYMESLILQVSILDCFGSILCCRQYRKNCLPIGRSWFEVLVACTLMQFGGTTLTGFLLGQTAYWIMSYNAFPALLISWWLTFFCPFDLYWKFLESNPWMIYIVGIGASISSGILSIN